MWASYDVTDLWGWSIYLCDSLSGPLSCSDTKVLWFCFFNHFLHCQTTHTWKNFYSQLWCGGPVEYQLTCTDVKRWWGEPVIVSVTAVVMKQRLSPIVGTTIDHNYRCLYLPLSSHDTLTFIVPHTSLSLPWLTFEPKVFSKLSTRRRAAPSM